MILRGDRLLKTMRKWRGLTQMQMAAQTGLAQGYLSDLESGRRRRMLVSLTAFHERPKTPPKAAPGKRRIRDAEPQY